MFLTKTNLNQTKRKHKHLSAFNNIINSGKWREHLKSSAASKSILN
jgi:hypothetical protein